MAASDTWADDIRLEQDHFSNSETVSDLNKITFSTGDLPTQFDDRARLSEWREFLLRMFGPLEVSPLPDRPFFQQLEATQFGDCGVARLAGTSQHIASTSPNTAAGMRPDFYLAMPLHPLPMSFSQRGHECVLDGATAALGSCTEPCDMRFNDHSAFLNVWIPHARLQDLVAGVEDLVARPLHAETAAMRHLRRYLALVAEPGGLGDDIDLLAHVETTLIDLAALALGANRDAAEVARQRGLRAARLQDILADIRTGFANPGFSPDDIARRLGVTPRYVQALLQEAGSSFTERVLELRLQRARAMLADRRCDRMRIGEIAENCGFNEISYFNRRFRRRFAASPSELRARRSPGSVA